MPKNKHGAKAPSHEAAQAADGAEDFRHPQETLRTSYCGAGGSEGAIERDTAYVDCGTPYADLVAHAFKFVCAVVLLVVQTFAVHRDVWPAKTMAVVRAPGLLAVDPSSKHLLGR